MRAIFRGALGGLGHALLGLLLATSCADEPLDDVRWACLADRECGGGRRCDRGLCVAADAASATRGLTCEPVAAGEEAVRFSIAGDDDARTLRFEVGSRSAEFRLPDDVIALDEAPLEACCQNPCCSFVSE